MSLTPEETPIPDEIPSVPRASDTPGLDPELAPASSAGQALSTTQGQGLEGDALDAYLQTLSDDDFYQWLEAQGGSLAWGG